MTRKINLGGQRARELIDRRQERARVDRQYFLENMPAELARKDFDIKPTPAKEVAKVVRMDSGYTFTEYKSLARLSVPFESGDDSRSITRTLPDIFEVTEIVYSGVGAEEDD